MNLVYTLKLICDLCFYLAFAGTICSVITGNGLMATLVYFFISAIAVGLLYNKPRLKFMALILLLPALYIVRDNIINYMFLLPAVAYTIYYIYSIPFEITRMEYADIFYLFLKIFIPPCALSMFIIQEQLENTAVPYAVLFILFSITLMRMIRHDKEVLNQLRFKIINSLNVAFVFLVSLLLSSKFFLNILTNILQAIYFTMIVPIINIILTIFIYMMLPLINALNLASLELEEMPPQEVNDMSIAEVLGEEILPDLGISQVLLKTIAYSFYILLIVLAIYLLYKLFKRFTTFGKSTTILVAKEERISIDVGKEKKSIHRTANQVRRIYKKFLVLCQRKGIIFQPYTTTKDIARISSHIFDEKENTYSLRDIYINTRYGEIPPSKEDIKKCRIIYNQLKEKK